VLLGRRNVDATAAVQGGLDFLRAKVFHQLGIEFRHNAIDIFPEAVVANRHIPRGNVPTIVFVGAE
jgi:hypothetical protein